MGIRIIESGEKLVEFRLELNPFNDVHRCEGEKKERWKFYFASPSITSSTACPTHVSKRETSNIPSSSKSSLYGRVLEVFPLASKDLPPEAERRYEMVKLYEGHGARLVVGGLRERGTLCDVIVILSVTI